jgi:ATP-dependent Clp protease ATP-binding subunit ClpB
VRGGPGAVNEAVGSSWCEPGRMLRPVSRLVARTRSRARLHAVAPPLPSPSPPPSAILFIDDIHTITGPNAQQGGGVMDASVMLKPLLSRCAPPALPGAAARVALQLNVKARCTPRSLPQHPPAPPTRPPSKPVPASLRGEVRCIGCTSLDKYRKFIEKDPGLERRFQQVGVCGLV